MNCRVKLYTTGEALPAMSCNNFFHSAELFHIIEKTPGQKPYMAVATDGEGNILGHMLAIIRRRGSWFPPTLYTQGRIYGEGEYTDEQQSEQVFGQLLEAVTHKLHRRFCFHIEFSDLSRKMFGYRYFRQNCYFPIGWQEIRNSLHSKAPTERISHKTQKRINRCYALGVETREATTEEEVLAFHHLLQQVYRLKWRRFIPPAKQFVALHNSKYARFFITLYKGKIIGGCSCVFSEGNAHLWYLASRRKRYPHLHPNLLTIWHAINWAWEHNYAHFCFLDVGLPYPKNPFRDFLLKFGGKPIAKYRWFRFSIGWLNTLLSWFYKE